MAFLKQRIVLIGAFLAVSLAGFGVGWFLHAHLEPTRFASASSLREGGYTFTQPLLMCDTDPNRESRWLGPLLAQLQTAVNTAQQAGVISTASVYYRDLTSGQQLTVNPNETFFPSSLRKIPLLIAIYKAAEANPSMLNDLRIKISGVDQNAGQEIAPRESAEIGKTYSVQELVEKMIRYSDNNSAQALTQLIGVSTLQEIFQTLGVPFVTTGNQVQKLSDIDKITAYQFSYFFRLLFNATYLDGDYSEKALSLLSQTEYANGIVSGVPAGTPVAHKFGLLTASTGGQVSGRELHDCGVVYAPRKPYLLCIMTKSNAPIADIEGFIKNVSQTVYVAVTHPAAK